MSNLYSGVHLPSDTMAKLAIEAGLLGIDGHSHPFEDAHLRLRQFEKIAVVADFETAFCAYAGVPISRHQKKALRKMAKMAPLFARADMFGILSDCGTARDKNAIDAAKTFLLDMEPEANQVRDEKAKFVINVMPASNGT